MIVRGARVFPPIPPTNGSAELDEISDWSLPVPYVRLSAQLYTRQAVLKLHCRFLGGANTHVDNFLRLRRRGR